MLSGNEFGKLIGGFFIMAGFAIFGLGAASVLSVYGLYRLYLYLYEHIQWVP